MIKVARSFLSNQALVEPLTNREIEILLILSKRLSNQEIAERLFISPETVKDTCTTFTKSLM